MNTSNLTKKQKKDYQLIFESKKFDEKYYESKYYLGDYTDSISHYLNVGVYKGYNPSPSFDTEFYLKNYPDVKKAKINPFVHYLKYGKKGHRIPKII